MGVIIFWFIVLMFILSSASKKNKRSVPVNKTMSNGQKQPMQNSAAPRQAMQNPLAQRQADYERKRKSVQNPLAQRQADYESQRQYTDEKQRQLKERLAKKYGKAAESDILQRAKASVAEDFSSSEYLESSQRQDGNKEKSASIDSKVAMGQREVMEQGTIDRQSVYMEQETAGEQQLFMEQQFSGDFRNGMEQSPESEMEMKQEDVLRVVEDLMVKGPDMELTFTRDFLAEGMDMLNRVQA